MIQATIVELMRALVRTEAIVREQQPMLIKNGVIEEQLKKNKETIEKGKRCRESLRRIGERLDV